jgi:HEAT repeat protein
MSSPWPRNRLMFALFAVIFAVMPGSARLAADTRQTSVESLVYDLKSPDALRRQAAARELGNIRFQLAIPQLVALSKDPVAAVRREVELALERMDDIQTRPGFVAFTTDPENDIRARGVDALVNLHLPRTAGVTGVLMKLRERIVYWSDHDLEVMVEPDVPIDPVVVSALRARIDDSDRGIRHAAIRGLGILRAPQAVPDLMRVVREDRDDGLRFQSVRALRKIADPSVAVEFVGFLNINDNDVRHELIATLGSMRYRGAVPELTRIAEQPKRTDPASVLALAALADIADPSSAPLFDRLSADGNDAVRLAANEGIARTVDASMKTRISAARLIEKSARVRTAQAFALLRLGDTEFLDELVRGLERPATRDLSREYLLETSGADRQSLFAPRQGSATVRAELADVLGLMGDPAALPRLQELTLDPDKDVARAAERATRRLAVTTGVASGSQ